MKNPYPNEKFSTAVDIMATSPDSIQRRVADAYRYSLLRLNPEDLPEEIQSRFIALSQKLTRIEPKGDEGSVVATTSQMQTDEAISIAKEILEMAHLVMRDYYNI